MKKYLLLCGIAILLILITGSSFSAVFTEGEAASIEMTAGSLELSVNDIETWQSTISVDNLAPGEERMYLLEMRNTGSLPGQITLGWVKTVNFENGQNVPEQSVDTSGGSPGMDDGELGSYLQTHFRLARTNGDFAACESETRRADHLNGFFWQPVVVSSECETAAVLQPGESVNFWVIVKLAEDCGNIVQSDSVELVYSISLEQVD